MFNLQIAFGTGIWMFLFKDKTKLDSALTILNNAKHTNNDFEFEDDFGSSAKIKPNTIAGILIEDMEKNGGAHIERALWQARTQNKAQSAARTDPGLRALTAGSGLPIMQPQGNGRM